MTASTRPAPILLCFDGSDDAANAIERAGRLLGPQPAVVLTVCEPIKLWSAADPATILDAPIGKFVSKRLELGEIANEVVQDELTRGVELARAAGFDAEGRVAHGKPWRVISEVAQDIDAAVIVLGARGRSPVPSALLGSVSAAVSTHAGRPVLVVHPSRVTGHTVRAGRSARHGPLSSQRTTSAGPASRSKPRALRARQP